MVISASRRTDIPGYYGTWFIKRVREGFCEVRNPFNPSQMSRISLLPGDVDLFVFWTRNGAPFLQYLPELDEMGFRYYFLYTLVQYPESIEPGMGDLERKLGSFMEVSKTVGFEKIIWRYDPIIISSVTGFDYHLEMFSEIAGRLSGYTGRVVISFLDIYKKVKLRLDRAGGMVPEILPSDTMVDTRGFSDMIEGIRETAGAAEMEIQSCAEKIDLSGMGIMRGKCIDDSLISRLFDLPLTSRKDPGQRKLCGCIPSRDIGVYNTCPAGCLYCYAAGSAGKGKLGFRNHDPEQPYL